MHLYQTSDLGLASALCCLGYTIVALDRHEPRRVVFCFERDAEGLDKAIRGFWDGGLQLPPIALFTHQKLLKKRIYDEHP